MKSLLIRKQLRDYIDRADERFVCLLYGMMKEDQKGNKIFTVDGKPLSQSQYKGEIDKARKGFDLGSFVSHHELEKNTKSW